LVLWVWRRVALVHEIVDQLLHFVVNKLHLSLQVLHPTACAPGADGAASG